MDSTGARLSAIIPISLHLVQAIDSDTWIRNPIYMPRQVIPKIDSLTTLRGYLATWVVFYHFWNDFIILFPFLKPLTPLFTNGHMAVPGFFILSGFVLALNYEYPFQTLSLKKVGTFLAMRLARVYPVHLVTLLIVLAMVVVSRSLGFQLTDSGYTAKDFTLNLLLIHAWVPQFLLNWNYPSWSISSEWFAYLFFPLLIAATNKRFKSITSIVATLLVCLATGTLWMMSQHQVLFYEMLLVVPLFIAGVMIYLFLKAFSRNIQQMHRHARFAQLCPLVAILLIGGACYLPEWPKIPLILTGFTVLIFLLAAFRDFTTKLWTGSIPFLLGESSYSLYMTHTLAQKVLYKILPSENFATSGILIRIGVFTAYLFAIFLVCAIIYWAVEKPCLEYFRKRIRKKNELFNSQKIE